MARLYMGPKPVHARIWSYAMAGGALSYVHSCAAAVAEPGPYQDWARDVATCSTWLCYLCVAASAVAYGTKRWAGGGR